MISATRNKLYILKKACFQVFVKDISGMYLNNIIYHIVLSLYLVRKCLCEHDCVHCLTTKEVKISQIHVLPWKQNRVFETKK